MRVLLPDGGPVLTQCLLGFGPHIDTLSTQPLLLPEPNGSDSNVPTPIILAWQDKCTRGCYDISLHMAPHGCSVTTDLMCACAHGVRGANISKFRTKRVVTHV